MEDRQYIHRQAFHRILLVALGLPEDGLTQKVAALWKGPFEVLGMPTATQDQFDG